MVSEQVTRACKIFRVIATISGSRVFKAANKIKSEKFSIQIKMWFAFKVQLLTFDWNDELRNDWKDFCTTLFKHIKDSLYRKESVRFLLLTDSLKEDR